MYEYIQRQKLSLSGILLLVEFIFTPSLLLFVPILSQIFYSSPHPLQLFPVSLFPCYFLLCLLLSLPQFVES